MTTQTQIKRYPVRGALYGLLIGLAAAYFVFFRFGLVGFDTLGSVLTKFGLIVLGGIVLGVVWAYVAPARAPKGAPPAAMEAPPAAVPDSPPAAVPDEPPAAMPDEPMMDDGPPAAMAMDDGPPAAMAMDDEPDMGDAMDAGDDAMDAGDDAMDAGEEEEEPEA